MSQTKQTEKVFQFRLIRIKTEQFAVIDGVFNDSKESLINTQLSFGFILEDRSVQVNGKFTFKQDENAYLVLSLSCWFQFPDEDWAVLYDTQQGVLKIPREVALNFCSIVIGTSRGVVHSKSEGMPFHFVILPPIQIFEMIPADVILETGKF